MLNTFLCIYLFIHESLQPSVFMTIHSLTYSFINSRTISYGLGIFQLRKTVVYSHEINILVKETDDKQVNKELRLPQIEIITVKKMKMHKKKKI